MYRQLNSWVKYKYVQVSTVEVKEGKGWLFYGIITYLSSLLFSIRIWIELVPCSKPSSMFILNKKKILSKAFVCFLFRKLNYYKGHNLVHKYCTILLSYKQPNIRTLDLVVDMQCQCIYTKLCLQILIKQMI